MLICNHCDGSGVVSPSSAFGLPSKCIRCAGSGHIAWNDLRSGDHVCYLCDDVLNETRNFAKFLAVGLQKGERCLCVLDKRSAGEISLAIESLGANVWKDRERGALLFAQKEDVYFHNGKFEPLRIIDQLRRAGINALRDGFTGLRVVAGADWVPENIPHYTEFLEYEHLADNFFKEEQPRITAICQYSHAELPSVFVLGAELAHRLVLQDF